MDRKTTKFQMIMRYADILYVRFELWKIICLSNALRRVVLRYSRANRSFLGVFVNERLMSIMFCCFDMIPTYYWFLSTCGNPIIAISGYGYRYRIIFDDYLYYVITQIYFLAITSYL